MFDPRKTKQQPVQQQQLQGAPHYGDLDSTPPHTKKYTFNHDHHTLSYTVTLFHPIVGQGQNPMPGMQQNYDPNSYQVTRLFSHIPAITDQPVLAVALLNTPGVLLPLVAARAKQCARYFVNSAPVISMEPKLSVQLSGAF
jgi:hypothetical protein